MRPNETWNKWLRLNFAPSGSSADAVEDVDADDTTEEVGDGSGVKAGRGKPAKADAESDDDDSDDDDTGDIDADAEEDAEVETTTAESPFKKFGLPEDPEVIARQLHEARAAAQERDQYRAMLIHQAQQRAMQEQAAQQQAAQKQEEARKKLWEIPKFDRSLEAQLMLDEHGNIVAKPGAVPTIPQDYNNWKKAREAAMDQALNMLADPVQFFQEHILPHTAKHYQEMAFAAAQQVAQQQQHQMELRRFEAENSNWVYEPGTRNLTPAAQEWNKFYSQGVQLNHPNPIEYATANLDAVLYRMRLEEEATQKDDPKKTREQKRTAFLRKGANRIPGRNGATKAKRTARPVDREDLFDDLEKAMADLPADDFAVPNHG